MTYEDLIAIPIQNIREEVLHSKSIRIYFDIQGFSYFIYVHHEQNNLFSLDSICHNAGGYCPLCERRKNQFCLVLERHRLQLFERLIQTNELRLLWLYRKYKDFQF